MAKPLDIQLNDFMVKKSHILWHFIFLRHIPNDIQLNDFMAKEMLSFLALYILET